MKIISAFGDVFHQNCVTRIDGGIEDDEWCQIHCQNLIALPSQLYYLPKGLVGHRFLYILTSLTTGSVKIQWNSKRLIVIPIVVPQFKKGVVISKYISRRL